MSSIYNKYDNLKTFDDLQRLVSDMDDGESTTIEFKSIRNALNEKSNLKEQKALLAKEICAFLNSNDGILVWGVGKNKDDNTLSIINESGANLEDIFDHNLGDLVEPAARGIEFKTIKNGDDSCLAIFVPHSRIAPHRTGDWDMNDKKRILGRYYGRSGSNSVPLPESMVRALYLSDGYIPRISIYTELEVINSGEIRLRTLVKPDPQRFISQYYNSNQVAIAILDGYNDFEIVKTEDNSYWREIGEGLISTTNAPIYPKEKEYEVVSSCIFNDKPEVGYEPQDFITRVADEDIHLTEDKFSAMFAIATKSDFACDGVPLVTKTRLYVVDSSRYWNWKNYTIKRDQRLSGLEKQFGIEIYVASTYDGIHDDRDVLEIGGGDNILRQSLIQRLLKELLSAK